MAEKPILFNGEMVRAILDGRKTQMRRPMKNQPQPVVVPGLGPVLAIDQPHSPNRWLWPNAREEVVASCPFGKPGDLLWVRESYQRFSEDGEILYMADSNSWEEMNQLKCEGDPEAHWRPSIHMPRWACRIVLEITDVRVERLQAISERDAIAEGVGSAITRDCKVPKFAALWDQLHGAGAWHANPWVWVIDFTRVEDNRHG
ncbi:hypothetical protein [Xanthomonas albilineans]|uniref:Phage-related protein n=1 Tax=Xanthomonas albilineans (strain GPE PC73 / CFBP 7063) TaxID=380358 RepID=D2U8I0_XANAP|nr:hypothetical protein [Xanthomonas albilineans]CBA14719.1 conserved hypothetical protein [Xanthomonas albilineans GPE PC73]